MSRVTAQMKIGAFLYPTGYHVAAWRMPDVPADAGVNLPYYVDVTQTAEAGLFDFIFLADSPGIRGRDWDALSRTAIRYVSQFEPFTLLSALAMKTDRIGLTASATTTYNEPYNLARKFASLDHISSGRAGWNLVTSQNEEEAFNFGLPAHPDHKTRYARAREFAQVVRGLWDSWSDDAFVRDKDSGEFFQLDKMHILAHEGKFFNVRGPLNIPRSPQGHPVVLQAGSSEFGKELAAETGEVVFTAQSNFDDARQFYRDVKARLSKYGRAPDQLKILVGVFPFVGSTLESAHENHKRLQSFIDPVVGLALLRSELGGADLSSVPIDGPLPPLPESNAGMARQKLLVELAGRQQWSIRQLYEHVAGGRGHLELIGTGETVADELVSWFEGGAADGFMIMAPALPGDLRRFVEDVIPALQRRGIFRDRYEGNTLRQNLGLARPAL